MELHQYRTDGEIDVTPLSLTDVQAAKITALSLVAHPWTTGVYRICFVDVEYERIAWDTHNLHEAPAVGSLAYAGAS